MKRGCPEHRQAIAEGLADLDCRHPPEPYGNLHRLAQAACSAADSSHLAAYCAVPDDESLKIVYAQWLDQRRDPRGEFLRLCCDLARVRWDSPRFRFGCLDAVTRSVCESKTQRFLELRDACLETWTGLPREYAERFFFDRGFIVGYRTDDVDELMAMAPALFRHPVRELHLITFSDDDVKTLCDCDFLHRLARLRFTDGIGDRALR